MDTPTIAEAAALLATRKLSPVELTRHCLGRIEALNPTLHAFIAVTPERAMADARAAEARLMAGTPRGKLDGIPIAHKDIYATRGIATTAHSRLLEDWVPGEDATTVRTLAEGRHGHARQARHPRVRVRRPQLRPALAPRAQPVEHGPFHLRLLLRHRRRGRRRNDPGRHRGPTPAAPSGARPPSAGLPASSPPTACAPAPASCRSPSRSTTRAPWPGRSRIARSSCSTWPATTPPTRPAPTARCPTSVPSSARASKACASASPGSGTKPT